VSYLLFDFLSQEEQMQKHHSRTFSISDPSARIEGGPLLNKKNQFLPNHPTSSP
jgi:hypothetical protein